MKKLFILILISLYTGIFAQVGKNRFEESNQSGFERTVDHTNEQSSDNPQAGKDGGAGNPGETVPIDDYLPLLGIAAVGIIIYYTRKKKNAIPNK